MPRPRNPLLTRLCEDTAFCLTQPGNPCGIPPRERQGLRDWHIRNCGGTPELVAITAQTPRAFGVGKQTRKLTETLRGSKQSKDVERSLRALNRALGKEFKTHLRLAGRTTVEVRAIFDRPPKATPNGATARKRLVVLRDGCTEYYGYYDDENQECVYIGAGYVEGCEAD